MKKYLYIILILGAMGILYVLLSKDSFLSPRVNLEMTSNSESAIVQVTAVTDLYTRHGSGVIIDGDDDFYYVLSNHHITMDALDISITLYDEKIYPGELINAMASYDLSLIRFERVEDLNIMEMSASYQPGDMIKAMGYPGGLFHISDGTITRTMILEDSLDFPVIHHSAEIYHGSSGGALIDGHGSLIGINYAVKDRDGLYIQSYAIPVAKVHEFLEISGHGLS
ncbi:MAG TPA: trypsin-like peptidase domain-containing protein [Acholeplasmataceae bacterium]|nr:trypsin-like peptidase domain-containing protein [Acholeplasmataceae bacterium]